MVSRAISLGVLFGLWEIAGRAGISVGLPPFSRVAGAFGDLLGSGRLVSAASTSGQALLIGFLISAVVGILCGIAMGVWPVFGHFFSSYFEALISLPVTALIPMILLLTGLGLTTQVLIVCIFSTPFIAMNTLAGLRDADTRLVEMARSFQANQWQMLKHVVLPAATPMIFTGLRVGLARAFLGVVTAEILLVPRGVGELIWEFRELFRYPELFAVVIMIIVVSVLILSGVQRMEAFVMRWRQS